MIPESLSRTAFSIDIGCYRGPLNILLHILQKREIEIREIVMRDIVHQLGETAQENMDFVMLEDSIGLIAKLILLKIECLIRQDRPEDFDITEDTDPELNEYDNYVELQGIKRLAVKLRENLIRSQKIHYLADFICTDCLDTTGENLDVSVSGIIRSYIDLFLSYEEFPLKKALSREEVSIQEMRHKMLSFISRIKSLQLKKDLFPALCAEGKREDLVLAFFTMLSLERDSLIHCCQEKNFDDIYIEKRGYGKQRNKK